MEGGEVVIAKTDEPVSDTNPGKYEFTSEGFALMPQQTLTNASFEQTTEGTTILRYTKLLAESGENEIFVYAPNRFIWAVGESNTYGYHKARGNPTLSQLALCRDAGNNSNATSSAEVDCTVAATAEQSGDYQKLWAAHGWLMAISWAILIPIGIGASLLRKLIPGNNGTWFLFHKGFMGFAFLTMTAGFGIAVYTIEKSTGSAHFSRGKHGTIGLVVYLFVFIQVLMGILRPSLPRSSTTKSLDVTQRDEDVEASDPSMTDSEETAEMKPPKSIARRSFEVGHRVLGLGLLGLAWYNCHTGIQILTYYFGEGYDATNAFWGSIGGLCGVILVMYVTQYICSTCKTK